MGVRSGGKPSVDQSFVQRLCHALDMTIVDLAREVSVGKPTTFLADVLDTLAEWQHASPAQLPSVDRDVVWFEILKYIDQQYAYIMAAKHELNSLLQGQRELRTLHTMRQQSLSDVSAPTSLPRRKL